jgi:hypothetical protein
MDESQTLSSSTALLVQRIGFPLASAKAKAALLDRVEDTVHKETARVRQDVGALNGQREREPGGERRDLPGRG